MRELHGAPTSYGLFFQEQRKLGVSAKSIRSLWLSKAEGEKVEYDMEAARRRCAMVEAKRRCRPCEFLEKEQPQKAAE